MKSSPLLSKPEVVPRFSVTDHPQYEAVVAKRVCEYFQLRWPWTSERQKNIYTQQDAEIWPLLSCPQAPEDRAEIAAKYCLFYFALDDILEDVAQEKGTSMVEGMKNVLLSENPPQNEIENIMIDIRSQMLSIGDKRTRELANNVFLLTAEFLELVVNRRERYGAFEQGLDAYLKYRRTDSGFWFWFGLFAWELDLDPIPQYIWEDPEFTKLLSLAADQMVLINDMYSYRHEAFGLGAKRREADQPADGSDDLQVQDGHENNAFNAISILMRDDFWDEKNVMDRLEVHIRSREAAFIDTVEKLEIQYKDRTGDLGIVRGRVAILTQWMGANYYWSTVCRRYNSWDELLMDNE